MKLSNRRKFIKNAVATGFAASSMPSLFANSLANHAGVPVKQQNGQLEWRNKQEGMHYRRLGRTNFMISELVFGGIPVTEGKSYLVKHAIESGINYIDTAWGYNRGISETEIGKVFKDNSAREKVFLATKVSRFSGTRNRMYEDVFKGLPASKQEKINKKKEALMEERQVKKPGYFYNYFPSQERQFEGTYLSLAMQDDYKHKVDETGILKKLFIDSVHESLQRMNTDYIDVILSPHGAGSPEDLHVNEMHEAFEQLRKEGKVRYMGVSTHNDPKRVVNEAVATNKFAMVLVAYNFINAGYLDEAVKNAYNNEVGIIAMKSAAPVTTHHEALKPLPKWREDKINQMIRNNMSAPLKAYLWNLQNPYVTAVVSHMLTNNRIDENLSIVGKKVKLYEA